ncbi:MAG TPA: SUMF1/EgtB/PvdO family nonheme iron enzyme [Desulfuromonadales bacterium]|nr:SUMF1/EgtB/PvdO family nonheme iron enzyme [Desulfuromonadales bacterium]
MTKRLLVAVAVIVFSANLAYSAENNTKKKAASVQPKTDKVVASPVPPKPFSDNVTGLEMVNVKGGCYQMGDFAGMGRQEEKPAHEVCVDDFYMGKYEVTQDQWKKIMGSSPSVNKNCGKNGCPVDTVSWNDVQEYISRLNSRFNEENKIAGKYRLPTEAEWEYAARSGGKSEQYSGSDILVDVACFFEWNGDLDYRWSPKPVGTKRPNGLGIYDMTGNVWEWTSDWYGSDYYAVSPKNNPAGPVSGDRRVLRGGGWRNGAFDLRTSYRNFLPPLYRSDSIGFRLVWDLSKKLPLQDQPGKK